MRPNGPVCATGSDSMPSALSAIKVALIDLDGVVYRGATMIEGADGAVRRLRQLGWRPVFGTNSSVKTRTQISDKLMAMGIPAEEDEVLTSAFVAAMLVGMLLQHAWSSKSQTR